MLGSRSASATKSSKSSRDTSKRALKKGCCSRSFWYQNYTKPGLRLTTQSNYEGNIYQHIIPQLGKIPLNQLTQKDIQQFYAHLKKEGRLVRTEQYGKGLSDRMVRMCHAKCRAALEQAMRENLIRTNPAVGCKLPPKRGREMQVLSSQELQRFLMQAQAEGYFELFLLDLSTGLRRGELLALQWSDLDMDTRMLSVTKQVYEVNGKLQLSVPKTRASIRKLVLPPAVVEVFRAHQKTASSRWLFPSPKNPDLPLTPGSVLRRLQIILERAGCKKIRFHDLRHPYVKPTTKKFLSFFKFEMAISLRAFLCFALLLGIKEGPQLVPFIR